METFFYVMQQTSFIYLFAVAQVHGTNSIYLWLSFTGEEKFEFMNEKKM